MLDILPALAWTAPITSIVLLVVMMKFGELTPRHAAILLAWFLLAGYGQFFAGPPSVRAAGLALQSLLAIYLFVRFKLSR